MMKACVICNHGNTEDSTRRFLDDVILNEADRGTLRVRLEVVLEEALYQEGWVCAQCQTKLKRIERYYSVVGDFRQQYWHTKKQQEAPNQDNGVTRERRVQLSDHTYNAGIVLQGGLLDAKPTTHNIYKTDHSDDDNDEDIQRGSDTYREVYKKPGPNKIKQQRSTMVDDTGPVSHGRDDSSPVYSKTDGAIRPYMCAACDEGFTQPRNLSYHIREEHTPTLTPSPSGSYVCNFCNKAHSMACLLVRHVRHHTGEKPFKCGLCRKVYTELGHLKYHMGVHSTNRFPCPVCKQVLGTKHSLQAHMVHMHGRCATSRQKQYHQNTANGVDAEAGEVEVGEGATSGTDSDTVTIHIHPDTETDKQPEEIHMNEQGMQVSDVYPVFVEGKGYTCSICNKCFRWPAQYQSHTRVHTGVRNYRCKVCGRRFKEASHLKSHMDTHSNYIYPCPVCHREHRTHVSLRIHMGKRHLGVPVPRPATFRNKHDKPAADEPSTPPKSRKSKRLCKAHRGVPASNMFHFKLKQVPLDKPASKPSPGSPGPSLFHFKLMQQEVPEQRPAELEVKEPGCTDADNKRKDMKVIADNDSIIDNAITLNNASIPDNALNLDNASILENVLALDSIPSVDNISSVDNILAEDNTPVVINMPDDGTPVHHDVEQVQVSEIVIEEVAADNKKGNTVRRLLSENKLHVCMECGKGFRNGIELTRHSLVHTGLRPHQCATCGKTYKHLSHLNTHMQTHNKIKPTFLCTTCGITVSSKTALNHHMKLHTRRVEKPSPPKPVFHMCTECDKRFATKRNLELHNRRHRGERPYVCKECKKAFTTRSCLTQHMVIHSGVHPYTCTHCGKHFQYRAQIGYHQRVHCIPSKACDECGKKFYDEASLINHQLTHAADSGCGNEGDLRGPVVASGLTSNPGYEETLTSHPGYRQTLAPASFCEWVLTPPPGLYVSLTIHDMGNISCHTQLFVYTYLDDNRYPGWNLCPQGYFPLDGTPYHLASARDQWLRVHYRGNKFPDLTTGFSASYGFREPGCSSSRELSGAPWWFASHPGAGSWAVEAGSQCTWTLTAPEGQYPALVGGRVDLHCVAGWQTLAVYDGNKQNNNSLIVVLTCTDQVSPLAASGRHLHLMYTDRWASHSLGFNISYRFYPVRQSGCGGAFLLTGTSGELSSFRLQDSGTYTPLSRCRWRLQAPPGVQLVLKFVTFDVTSRYTEGSCSRDIVVLREGGDRSASGVRVYCNGRSAPPPVIMPHHHQLEVFFATESLSNEYTQGKGFTLRYSRTCSPTESASNVLWSSPDENKDGVIIISPGESVLSTCAEGFMATSGHPRRVCGENGTMSGKPILCLSVRCEDIPSPRFTSHQTLDVNMDGRDIITYKDVLRYACITGYVPTSGDTERACQAEGTLSGHDLVCIVKQCAMYPSLPHSTALPMDSQEDGADIVSYGEVIVYTCHHGYQEVRGNSVRKCQEDGTYSGEDLVCAPRVCKPIPVPRGSRIMHQDDVNMDGEVHISYMEVVPYSCVPGYSPTGGPHTRVCTATGALNGTDILCQPNPCSKWPVAGVGTMRKAGEDGNDDGVDLVSYGETLIYTCRPGYTATTGDTLRVCQDNGTFNGTQLVCVVNTETKPQRKPSLARPTVIGTAVCLSFLLILLVLVVSLLAARGHRRRSATGSHDTSSRSCDLTFKSPTPHHALTLHRVTTPWEGGGHLGLSAAPETLRRPGLSYIRWPMYLWDDQGTGTATGRHVTLTGQSDSMQGTALPLAC